MTSEDPITTRVEKLERFKKETEIKGSNSPKEQNK